jgi:hypothetical protein
MATAADAAGCVGRTRPEKCGPSGVADRAHVQGGAGPTQEIRAGAEERAAEAANASTGTHRAAPGHPRCALSKAPGGGVRKMVTGIAILIIVAAIISAAIPGLRSKLWGTKQNHGFRGPVIAGLCGIVALLTYANYYMQDSYYIGPGPYTDYGPTRAVNAFQMNAFCSSGLSDRATDPTTAAACGNAAADVTTSVFVLLAAIGLLLWFGVWSYRRGMWNRANWAGDTAQPQAPSPMPGQSATGGKPADSMGDIPQKQSPTAERQQHTQDDAAASE